MDQASHQHVAGERDVWTTLMNLSQQWIMDDTEVCREILFSVLSATRAQYFT